MDQPSLRLAVLIDADNSSYALIGDILKEVASLGRASVKRIYGDFTTENLKSWGPLLAEHAIQPIQQYRNTVKKNASDSALIIDAMDLLHSRRLDGFCLVSSDSDFTRLATRIKEDGLPVYGFGEQKTPNSFVKACDRFIYTEVFKVKLQEDIPPAPTEAATPPGTTVEAAAPAPIVTLRNIDDEDFKDALTRAIDAATPTDENRAHLGTVGLHLQKLLPEFDSRNYGFKKLSDLFATIPTVKLSREGIDGGPQTVYVERI
jgi:uncharacterized LabA/DUF88 family protein